MYLSPEVVLLVVLPAMQATLEIRLLVKKTTLEGLEVRRLAVLAAGAPKALAEVVLATDRPMDLATMEVVAPTKSDRRLDARPDETYMQSLDPSRTREVVAMTIWPRCPCAPSQWPRTGVRQCSA